MGFLQRQPLERRGKKKKSRGGGFSRVTGMWPKDLSGKQKGGKQTPLPTKKKKTGRKPCLLEGNPKKKKQI